MADIPDLEAISEHDVGVVWFSHDGHHMEYAAICYTCPWRGAMHDPSKAKIEMEAQRHRKATGALLPAQPREAP